MNGRDINTFHRIYEKTRMTRVMPTSNWSQLIIEDQRLHITPKKMVQNSDFTRSRRLTYQAKTWNQASSKMISQLAPWRWSPSLLRCQPSISESKQSVIMIRKWSSLTITFCQVWFLKEYGPMIPPAVSPLRWFAPECEWIESMFSALHAGQVWV